ncbi:MAG: VCBS repeat-containing protein [Planctomycetota bacterium]|nr:VCBS repeat-containing protein [Planctomycetota bacterium]
MNGTQLLMALALTAGLAGSATADAPLVFCLGKAGGGHGPRDYTYFVDAVSYPMMEFTVGTMDPDPAHYRNVLIPPGWQFEVEPEGMGHACGFCAGHGEVSFGPCYSLTNARARWWTESPAFAVEQFVFGYDHRWTPEDVSWHLWTRREGEPPEWFEFFESWDSPVGGGMGPLHGPWTTPDRFHLAPGEIVCDDAGNPIEVPGYSVPRFVHWNGDELPDLVIGEGGLDGEETFPGKVRVYLNSGWVTWPVFQEWFYAQTEDGDLSVPGSMCQGACPCVVHWDGDGRKDLLVGLADGHVRLFLNVNTDDDPIFDEGRYIMVGEGEPQELDVGARAVPTVGDFDRDGKKDLLVGALDGKFHVFINEGAHHDPVFHEEIIIPAPDGEDLVVPSQRSSPFVGDFNGDGMVDLLTGNTEGELLFYRGWEYSWDRYLDAAGVRIDLPGDPRSRPSVCDWTADNMLDVLVGAGDGLVHLFSGVPTMKFVHSTDWDPYEPIEDPMNGIWKELWPRYMWWWGCVDWYDNGNGELDACDHMYLMEVGGRDEGSWWHVEKRTVTVMLEADPPMYLEWIRPFGFDMFDPIGQWHEVYPRYCTPWNCVDWIDDGNEMLDAGDYLVIVDPDGTPFERLVLEVGADLNLWAERPPCPADITGPDGVPDGFVNTADLLFLLSHWGEGIESPANINADLSVNTADLLMLLGEWGECP